MKRREGARGGICAFFLTLGIHTLNLGAPEVRVDDLGWASGFQDSWDNHYRRGRSIVSEDFDGDGRVDFFVGNPGDESLIYRNLGPGPDGVVRFAPAQVLLEGELASVASGADYDNDSDLDLFVGCGGLEGLCLDYLFRNDSVPGRIRFTDVTREAGIRGPSFWWVPLAHSTGGGTWGDYDRDGDQDLFVSVREIQRGTIPYKSVLWRNNGDGTFTDWTSQADLDYWEYDPTGGRGLRDWGYFQNSTWIDADNDGDLDLFLNNAQGPNVLWKNLLGELGRPWFTDATLAFSLWGQDLRFPFWSFAGAVADFNNDGWQDLILFSVHSEPSTSPYGNGNGLFLNRLSPLGQGFFNASSPAGINMGDGEPEIAMGCQVADLNADGIPDLIIGAGNPGAGVKNRLLLSRGMSGEVPLFEDATVLIDFEPAHGIDPASPPYPEVPPYPYRTHGMAAADFDGDGRLELGVVNGGQALGPSIVREPNRLFRFSGPGVGRTFRVRLGGDGLADSRDAIGARAYVEIPSRDGRRRVFQTVLGGSGFSAQNELTLTFGLGTEGTVSRLAILWPSGCLQVLDEPEGGSPSPLIVGEACWACPGAPTPVKGWLDPEAYGCAEPPACRLEGTVRDAFGPVPWTRVLHQYSVPPHLLAEDRSGIDGTFAVEHPYEPGLCRTTVLEPFGYLPVTNPVLVEESTPGGESLDLMLIRGPEGRWPQGRGYWVHQAKSLISGQGRAQEGTAEMETWMEEIRARYPGLGGFDSLGDLAGTLRGRTPDLPSDRLHRNLAAALLNLASGRLSSFTALSTGEAVGTLVEDAYLWLGTPGPDPAEAEVLAARLEALNEGLLLP